MVVVVIISLIAGVVLPKILRSFGEEDAVAKRVHMETVHGSAGIVASETTLQQKARATGASPIIEDAKINVELEAKEQRVGMEVFTRFEAKYVGDFTLRMAEGDDGPMQFTVFLPLNTAEAEDLTLVLRGAGYDGEPKPEELFIDHLAVTWVGTIPKPGSGSTEKRITARLSFTARGQELFVYRLPPAWRARSGA